MGIACVFAGRSWLLGSNDAKQAETRIWLAETSLSLPFHPELHPQPGRDDFTAEGVLLLGSPVVTRLSALKKELIRLDMQCDVRVHITLL